MSDLTLTPADRAEIAEHTDAIKRLASRSGQDIIEIGRHLIAVKERIDHGKFAEWITDEFGWSYRTARRFMQVADAFGETGHGGQFEAKALYALASGDVPEEVREQFIAQAESGEPVRYRDVREAVKAATPTPGPDGMLPIVDLETGEVIERASLEPDVPEIVGASQAQALKIKAKLDAMPPEQRIATIHQIRANEPGVLEELVDLPPLPSGPSAHERAAVLRSGTKWISAIDEIRMRVNSVRDHGGIRQTTKTWTPKGRAGLLGEIDRLIDQLTVIRDELEDFIHVA